MNWSALVELVAVKSDGRTLVTMDSIKRYVASLQPAQIAPRLKRKPQHLRKPAAVSTVA